MEELLGRRGELQLLRRAAEFRPGLADLFDGRFVLKGHEHRRHVAVAHRDAQALRGDAGRRGLDDLVALDVPPQLERLNLALFLLPADIGDDIIHHLRPGRKGFAGAGNRLIGAGQHFGDAKTEQWVQRGHIALQRAVGLDCDEAALGAEALSLRVDDLGVFGVDLGDDHGNILGVPVRGIVGDYWAFQLGIAFFKRANLCLGHVDGAEHEIDIACDRLCIGDGVPHNKSRQCFRDRRRHSPTRADRFRIGLAGRAGRSREDSDMKPGVVFQQAHKALADHAGRADDAYIVLLHREKPPK